MMKKTLTCFMLTFFSFFIMLFGSNISKAATQYDCNGTVNGLNITCTYGAEAADSVKKAVNMQTAYDISLYNAYEMSAEAIESKMASQENHDSSSTSVQGFSEIVSRTGYDVKYWYDLGNDKASGLVDQIYVRGMDALIFQDLTDTQAYNTSYTYTYCTKRFIWCTGWSSAQVKDIYTRGNSKYEIKNDKLVYTDLSGVQIVLPSFEIEHDTSIPKNITSPYWGSTTVYNMKGRLDDLGAYSGKEIYKDSGIIKNGRGCFLNLCSNDSKGNLSQVLMTTLVMEYTADVQFYYLDNAADADNDFITLKMGTAKAKVYVTYTMNKKAENKTMQALNGYNSDSHMQMDKGGITKNISFVPVQYDISSILNPEFWSNIVYGKGTKTISKAKLSAYNPIDFGGKKVYSEFTTVDDNGIKIRAIGLDTERSWDTITLDVTGVIHYKGAPVEDFAVSYNVGDGETNTITNKLGSYLYKSGECLSCGTAIEIVNQKIQVDIDPKGNNIAVYVKEVDDATSVKNFHNSTTFTYTDTAGYVGQSANSEGIFSIDINSNKQRLSIIKIVYTNQLGSVTTYYLPFIVDKIAPTIEGFTSKYVKGHYLVVLSEEELETLSFVGTDNVTGSPMRIPDPELTNLDKSTGKYKYTLVIKDEAGNETSAVYDVIIDSEAPNSINGAVVPPIGSEVSLEGSGVGYDEITQTIVQELDPIDSDSYVDYTTYLDSILGDLESKADLTNLTPYDVILKDEGQQVGLKLTLSDVGVYEVDNAGLRGYYIKHWIYSEVPGEGESSYNWGYQTINSNSADYTTTVALEGGINYVAVISLDYVDRFYKQTIKDLESEITTDESVIDFEGTLNVRIYAIRVYGSPYISNVIASDGGFGVVVRDDLPIFKSSKINTVITDYLLVDKAGADSIESEYETTTDQVLAVLSIPSNFTSVVIGNPKDSVLGQKVMKNRNYSILSSYVNDFTKSGGPGFVAYNKVDLYGAAKNAASTKIDATVTTFDNQMLINGMLLGESAYLFVEVTIYEGGTSKKLYQKALFANESYKVEDSPTVDLRNNGDDTSIGNIENVFSVSGNDNSSYFDGEDLILNYSFDLYKNKGDASSIYNPTNYIVYYKTCYETAGSLGVATVCRADGHRYYDGEGINLGKVNGDILYKVYVGVVTALKYNHSSRNFTEQYNNSEGYNVFAYESANYLANNDVAEVQHELKETYYEIYFGKFLYDTSIPEVIIEYTTIAEYQEGQINKLKDVNYAEEYGERYNFIIKVTVKYDSNKYRKPQYWTQLDEDALVSWFPYYSSTGRSVCGNEDRVTCDPEKSLKSWRYLESLSNGTTYDPNVGLVYYLQFPLTEDIRNENAAYSVDVFDLMIQVKGSSGTVNNGMTLIVDDVVRKSNVDFLTIYYDQDGPDILITSSPDKFKDYYSISIHATDVSSNVAKVSFYYGKYVDASSVDGTNVFLLYSQDVNAKEFQGYSAQLTQKGWYTVVAEDEIGLQTVYQFEVVQMNDGVLFSPTLDDTDQVQDDDNDVVIAAAALVTSIVPVLIIIALIGLLILIFVIWWKLRNVRKVTALAGKFANSEMGKKIIDNMPESKYKLAAKVVQNTTKNMPEVKQATQQQQPPQGEVPEEIQANVDVDVDDNGDGED